MTKRKQAAALPATQSDLIENIRVLHKRRRYAMKVQQKIDRAMESFIRINATAWTFDADEKERAKFNREVQVIITAARQGEGDTVIVNLVRNTDKGREPFDVMRDAAETEMKRLGAALPVAGWVTSVHGAGHLGLATIVGEAGDLSNYSSPAKLWNRLGFAPYDGLAGSTWKREKWRTRALTKQEWIDHPFSGQRYALMRQIAEWLVNAQWIAADKSEDGEGKPNGPYGKVYFDRRKHTLVTHPDWSKGHSRSDGLRIAMKAFLKDLWREWTHAPPPEKFVLRAGTSPKQAEQPPKVAAKRKRAPARPEARV